MKGQLTRNFKIDEFRCPCCKKIEIDVEFIPHVLRLQQFRSWYMRPININSGYRCKQFNSTLDNAYSNSLHLRGLAVDFNVPPEFYQFTKTRKEEFIGNIINKWKELEGSGVGIYDTFIHLDSGRTTYKDKEDFKIYDFRKVKNYLLK